MPFTSDKAAKQHTIGETVFRTLASPSNGSLENSVWVVAMAPRTPATPHSITREEIFVVLEGYAVAKLDGQTHELTPGSALVVPAQTVLELSNPSSQTFKAVCILPVGGQAVIHGQPPFTPPWAM